MAPRKTEPEPRRRLDHEQVMTAAEALVDRDGWAELTMTHLAAELGVKVPSLYNHVRDLDALQAELQNRTMAELGERIRDAAVGRTRADAFLAMSKAHRDFAVQHPDRYSLAMRRPLDMPGYAAAGADAMAAMTTVIESFGVPSDEVLGLLTTAFAAVHGVVALETAGFFEPAVLDPDEAHDRILELVLDLLDDRTPRKAAS